MMNNLNLQSLHETSKTRNRHPLEREHNEWLEEYDNLLDTELNDFKEFEEIYSRQQRKDSVRPLDTSPQSTLQLTVFFD
jgi:hypothetical protein